ncbi:UNVERIFIED_CONTAM: hypothetical protein GTU68_030277 [Idotea baltica]|nr:hypothetical protein [Idotea baltica]
MKLETG